MNKKQPPSELRYDLISKDWVVVATGRAKRPEAFRKEKRQKETLSKTKCPFCNISGEKPIVAFNKGEKIDLNNRIPENWTTIVLPNKYPAFSPFEKLDKKSEDHLYQRMNAVGFHELVITGDHEEQLGEFDAGKTKEVINAYSQRFLSLKDKKFVNYISIFHNHGMEAGASIAHPHSQIITTPLIDSDLRKALTTSEEYYKKNKECIYCKMNKWEKKKRERIVFENDKFLVLCPFASKAAFEVIISPKEHRSRFEEITETEKVFLAEAFQQAFGGLYRGLDDPPYNFYLHTAPCDGEDHPYYHWHFTILPKTATWAGFEVGTKMEISTITPEKAAEHLRKQ